MKAISLAPAGVEEKREVTISILNIRLIIIPSSVQSIIYPIINISAGSISDLNYAKSSLTKLVPINAPDKT
jgi:hypothetical protein